MEGSRKEDAQFEGPEGIERMVGLESVEAEGPGGSWVAEEPGGSEGNSEISSIQIGMEAV